MHTLFESWYVCAEPECAPPQDSTPLLLALLGPARLALLCQRIASFPKEAIRTVRRLYRRLLAGGQAVLAASALGCEASPDSLKLMLLSTVGPTKAYCKP
jgi:hypothetical protein